MTTTALGGERQSGQGWAQAGRRSRRPLDSHSSVAPPSTRRLTPRAIITDCLYAGHPAIDGGMFKTGKTLLAIDGDYRDCERSAVPKRIYHSRANDRGVLLR